MKRFGLAAFRCLSPIAYLLCIFLLAGAIGQVMRDRWVASALLMWIPLLPIALLSLVLDLARRGRALRGVPFGLSVFAIGCAAWSIYDMTGFASPAGATQNTPLRLVQWNVQWGGGFGRSEASFAKQIDEIRALDPDIVILSEAPEERWLPALSENLQFGPVVFFQNEPNKRYWYRMAVASRWPVRKEGTYPLTNGVAMLVAIEMPGREVRLLVVDGVSNPLVSRLPLLRDVNQLQRSARMLGLPIDVIAGDFNATSRSLGFDVLRDSGYSLAAESAGGWRGTFPSFMPLYDLDHVWASRAFAVEGCDFFAQHRTTNHRGQLVVLRPRGTIAASVAER